MFIDITNRATICQAQKYYLGDCYWLSAVGYSPIRSGSFLDEERETMYNSASPPGCWGKTCPC